MSRLHVNSVVMVMLVLALAATSFSQDAKPSSDKLAAVLQSDAGQKEKMDACRMLQRVGTKDVVPVLARLLTDEKLSHMARYALEAIPSPAVDDALRDALGKTKGRVLAGVIGSIGVRRDAKAVEAVGKLLADGDADVAQAAARALGSIGTQAAGKAITAALPKAPDANRLAFCEGLLRCAEHLTAGGSRKEAVAIYDSLRGMENADHQVRTAAIRGAILARQKEGLGLLKEYLQNKDYAPFAAACRASQEMAGADVTQILADAMKQLPADNQILVIQTLGLRGDKGAVPALSAAAKAGDKAVRLAAIRALAEIRDASSESVLKELTNDADAGLSKAAKEGLGSFEAAKAPKPGA